jgi:surfeit locus 1 family protein
MSMSLAERLPPHLRFQPRLVTTLITIAFCALTIALGQWQTRRAEEKLARQQVFETRMQVPSIELDARLVDPAALEWARVSVRGEWVPSATIYLDNKVHQQRVGYQVLTPLRLAGSTRHVLVDRGWIAAGPRRGDLPEVSTPTTPITVEGIVIQPTGKFFELTTTKPEGRLWQNLALDRYRVATGLDLQPIVLVQTSVTEDALIRRLDRPGSGAERNRAYALQWYSFATIAMGLYVFLSVRRATG